MPTLPPRRTLPFKLPLKSFDASVLPEHCRQVGSLAFQAAVVDYYTIQYAREGLNAVVSFDNEFIEVSVVDLPEWTLALAVKMLKAGQVRDAVSCLEALTKTEPVSTSVLFNLGLGYSELGQFDDAVIRLKRVVALEPGNASAWVGIGKAYHHMLRNELALDAFERAVSLNPEDSLAARNLGGLLVLLERPGEAVRHLRRALALTPADPYALFGLALALHALEARRELDNFADGSEAGVAEVEADDLLVRFLREHPHSELAEKAEQERTAFAQKRMRSRAPGGFRMDVVMYLIGAMKTFRTEGPQKRKEVAYEVAVLGRSGLDINDATPKYKLKSLPGEFTGIHLLALMYAAFQELDPTLDVGVDFSEEYRAATAMQERAGNRS